VPGHHRDLRSGHHGDGRRDDRLVHDRELGDEHHPLEFQLQLER
jgi:hypothetical protein